MGGEYAGTLAVMAEQSTGRGARGVVAAAAPLAAALGAEAIRSGGNAFDGAITAALAETVLLPPKCGLAGDLVALCLGPGDDEPEALVAIGGAPAGLAKAIAGDDLPATGPLSVGVPGAPAGYKALADRGVLPLARLAAPAARLARGGFVWASICETLAHESHELVARWNPSGTVYFPGGQPLTAGTIVRLPGLADVLDEYVARDGDLFAGPVGDAVLTTIRRHGGIVTADDLAAYGQAVWTDPARGQSAGHTVWATPAPTHGPSLLDAVAEAGREDDLAAVWHRVHLAIARRRGTLTDPRGGTSMVSAADADGNAVAIIHSNSFPRFGSGLVVDGYDLILANRAGRGFTAKPGHPNHPSPGKRPATTLHVWAWGSHDGRAQLLGATPGGANQMPWNAQLLQQLVDGDSPLGMLVVAPRWEWLPSEPPPLGPDLASGIRVEAGIPDDHLTSIRSLGAHVERVPRWGLRSAQQVVARPAPDAPVVAAVDPRTGGAVVAV